MVGNEPAKGESNIEITNERDIIENTNVIVVHQNDGVENRSHRSQSSRKSKKSGNKVAAVIT